MAVCDRLRKLNVDMKKKIIICIVIAVGILIMYMPLKTVYIEILSKLHTVNETHQRADKLIDGIRNNVVNSGYSIEKIESFCSQSMSTDYYEVKSDKFIFFVDITNEKDIETMSISFSLDKYSIENIDVDTVLAVFNGISACNISKRVLKKSFTEIEKSNIQINNEDTYKNIYTKELLFLSDLSEIHYYINENEKYISLSGVPKLFA